MALRAAEMPPNNSSDNSTSNKGRESTFVEKTFVWLHEKFIYSLNDDVRDLPDKAMYAIGILGVVTGIALFCSFMSTSFKAAIESSYLVPVDSNDSGICVDVPRPIPSGVYMIDEVGKWTGAIGFDPSKSSISLEFVLASMNTQEYNAFMNDLRDNIEKSVGTPAKNRNLAKNIVAWTNWQYPQRDTDNGNFQLPRFLGDPAFIFGSSESHWHGSVYNSSMLCIAPRVVTFDVSRNLVTMSYPAMTYMDTSSYCNALVDSKHLVPSVYFDNGISVPTVDFSFDIRTLLLASAIHFKILTNEACGTPAFSNCLVSRENKDFGTHTFYDKLYIGMDPLTCLSPKSNTDDWWCLMRLGNDIEAFPVFVPVGDSKSFCNCSSTSGRSRECNQFNFFVAFIVFQDINDLFELFSRYDSPEELNSAAYVALTNATDPTQNITDPERFAFCSLPHGSSCTIINFQLLRGDTTSINGFYYELPNGSCADSFTPTVETWTQATEVPPSSLIENYKQCKPKPIVAFFNSFAIASGNATNFTPLVILIIIQIYMWYMGYQKNGVQVDNITKKFTTEEKRLVVEEFVNHLLRRKRDVNLLIHIHNKTNPLDSLTTEDCLKTFDQILYVIEQKHRPKSGLDQTQVEMIRTLNALEAAHNK